MNKLDKKIHIDPEKFSEGIVYAPWVTKNVKTTLNNITVWHSNKLINLWLKVKFFFWKPKELKDFEKYANKKINSKYYTTIKINKNEQTR